MPVRKEIKEVWVSSDGRHHETEVAARDHDRLYQFKTIFSKELSLDDSMSAAEVLYRHWSDFQAIWNEHADPLPLGLAGRDQK